MSLAVFLRLNADIVFLLVLAGPTVFVVIVVVVISGRTRIFLAAFLLDAVTPAAASPALAGTFDPVAGRGREIVRVTLAELVCFDSKYKTNKQNKHVSNNLEYYTTLPGGGQKFRVQRESIGRMKKSVPAAAEMSNTGMCY